MVVVRSINFNPAERMSPLVENTTPVTNSLAERVLNSSLPIMQMFAATRPLATFIGGSYSIIPFGKQSYANYLAKDKMAITKNVLQVALITGSIAGSILFPIPTAIASYTYQFGIDIASIIQHVKKQDYQAAAADLFKIVNQALYVGGAILGGPELLFLALVLQAGKELYQANDEFAKGKYIETGAKVLAAVLRLYASHPHLVAMNRDWFGKNLTQEELKSVLGKAVEIAAQSPDQLVDFDKILAERGYSSHLKNLTFSNLIQQISFRNLKFQKCNFEKTTIQNSEFLNSKFNFVKIIDSIFTGVKFHNCQSNALLVDHSKFSFFEFRNSIFDNSTYSFSNLSKGVFFDSKMNNQAIYNSDLDAVAFMNHILTNSNVRASIFDKVAFRNSEIESVIFDKNQNSKDTKLSDVIFAESKVTKVSFNDAIIHTMTFDNSEVSETTFSKASNLIFT